jgi:hypothetical protein
MKFQLRNLILGTILGGTLSLGSAHAAGSKPQVLSDREMAAIEGGFCLFKKCETGAPSGRCQPLAPTYQALCQHGTCLWVLEPTGMGPFAVCKLLGMSTCTRKANYRSCIQGSANTVCWPSNAIICGSSIDPICQENLQDKTCECSVHPTSAPCDWTDCLLESQ